MFKKVLLIVVIYALFGGCSNKLNLLAPYKESVSVYGLLDSTAAINYIRVERVFMGAGSAYTMAQNLDSAYFQAGELTVSLQRWNVNTGQQGSVDVPASANMQIVLSDTLVPLNSGTFNATARVYKTNYKLYTDSNYVYKLIIQNNKTGKQYTAQTGMVSDFQLLQTLGNDLAPSMDTNHSNINIVPGDGGIVICEYNSPVNAGVCGLILRLFYTEANGGSSTAKSVDLGLGTNYPLTTSGGEKQNFDYSGTSLLSYIASAVPLPESSSITRTITKVDFILTAGGKDLALYNQVNASTSLSQNTPNYSNISNGGIGVFSSRYHRSLGRLLTKPCIDTLSANSQTCKLNFANEFGVPTPCNH